MRCAAAVFAATLLLALGARAEPPVHGLAMHGAPKYAADFKNFDYVNPGAPKGGTLRYAAIGTFDSFNPYIVKGMAAAGEGLTYDTLLTPAADEPFTVYGLVAQSLEVPADRSWVVFTLRPEAKFNDGSAITADDVVFSFETLKAKGEPQFRLYYAAVTKAEKLAERRVKFTFAPGENRELPLIVGEMPVLSKAYWKTRKFEETTLEPPLGSGPYKVESFEPNRFVVYKRQENYWAKDLPVRKGQFNFDRVRYDYYRDSTVALEAFKAGEYDLRLENEAKKWATGYDFPAVGQGLVKKDEIGHHRSSGMQGFAFNTRRPLFADPRVRQALAFAFDFEWTNKTLFYGQYARTESYFPNSELAATGLPSPQELKILEPLRPFLPAEVFTTAYHPPATDGSGNVRDNLKQGLELLKAAGWAVKDGKLADAEGRAFVFEILNNQPTWERVLLPFVKNLEKLGIVATVRTVDPAQYKNRLDDFDYDMTVEVWGASESPGNEQRAFWGSAAADQRGSRNVVGIKNKGVDALVDAVVAAPDREALVTRTRALDRALLWGHYVVPNWHLDFDRVAYWDKFGHPAVVPRRGVQLDAWWYDAAKPAAQTTKTGGR